MDATEYYFYISLCLRTDQSLRMCQIDYIVYDHINIEKLNTFKQNINIHTVLKFMS